MAFNDPYTPYPNFGNQQPASAKDLAGEMASRRQNISSINAEIEAINKEIEARRRQHKGFEDLRVARTRAEQDLRKEREALEQSRKAYTDLTTGVHGYGTALREASKILESTRSATEKYTDKQNELRNAIDSLKKSEEGQTEAGRQKIASMEQAIAVMDGYKNKIKDSGQEMKNITNFASGMFEALGLGGVGKYMAAGGAWGILTAGVIEFTSAVKKAHDELRALRNEGMWIGGIMTGGVGGGGEARFGEAGQFMGRALITRLMTGMTEKEQAQMLGAGARTGVITNMEQGYSMMPQMWALGKRTGIAPEQLMGMSYQMMLGGIGRTQVPQELLTLANNARAAGESVEVYMNSVIQLNAMTRRYGATLDENNTAIRFFIRDLQMGRVTLEEISQLSGAGLAGRGAAGTRAFIAQYGTERGLPGFEQFRGMDPWTMQAQVRGLIQTGRGEDFVRAASGWASEEARKLSGVNIAGISNDVTRRTAGERSALAFYQELMAAAGINTPENLEATRNFARAAELLKDPSQLMKEAATGLITGQHQMDSNIDKLTKEVLQDYQYMKSLVEQISNVLQMAMFQITIGLNDFLAKFGAGAFAGPSGAKTRAAMIGAYGTNIAEALGTFGENAPGYIKAGQAYVANDLSRTYGVRGSGMAIDPRTGQPYVSGYSYATLPEGVTAGDIGINRGNVRKIYGDYGENLKRQMRDMVKPWNQEEWEMMSPIEQQRRGLSHGGAADIPGIYHKEYIGRLDTPLSSGISRGNVTISGNSLYFDADRKDIDESVRTGLSAWADDIARERNINAIGQNNAKTNIATLPAKSYK